MTRWQSVKITFDLDDEYQLKLYNYLKNRTNGSSYVRTLLHQDMNGGQVKQQSVTMNTQPPDEIVNEQVIINNEQPDVNIKSESSAVIQATHHDIKINTYTNNEDIYIEDLI
jgi:hypothetical protein